MRCLLVDICLQICGKKTFLSALFICCFLARSFENDVTAKEKELFSALFKLILQILCANNL